MKRWKEAQLQKPRLLPDPAVSATASLQRDMSSVMAIDDISMAKNTSCFGLMLHKFKTAHNNYAFETTRSL